MNNDLNYLKIEILKIFKSLDCNAISHLGLDEYQILDWRKVNSKLFSDTIILYQEKNDDRINEYNYVWGSSFVTKCSLLHRLAFEAGLPIRGAISFGEYYVDEKCIIGKPIVEAYREEKRYEWSGTVLCNSVDNVLKKHIKSHPIDHHLIVPYKAPLKDSLSLLPERNVLRWDDILSKLYENLEFNPLNPEGSDFDSIKLIIKEKMKAHNKCKDERIIEKKVYNTSTFVNTYPPFLC